jgi:hypothetical protein
MNVNRRDVLRGAPAAPFGFNFSQILEAQAQNPAAERSQSLSSRKAGAVGK